MLTFKEFQKSRIRVTDPKVLEQVYDRDHPMYVYEGGCHIDIINSDTEGRYELIIENTDSCSDDLYELEHHLYYFYYLPNVVSHQELIEFVTGKMLEIESWHDSLLANHYTNPEPLKERVAELEHSNLLLREKLEKVSSILSHSGY